MKTILSIWWVLLVCSVPAARSQVLVEDPQFSVLHTVGWGMSMSEIRSAFEKINKTVSVTESSLTLHTEHFGAAAVTEFRFQKSRRGPAFIRIKFNEPSKILVDTITKHFTQLVGKVPTMTATEKKLFTINLRIEVARWKSNGESVALTTALQDGVIGDVGLILSMPAD